jgi:DNA-binding response OmpR family regulator
VLRALRGRGKDLPVIVITGQVDEHDAVACLEAGADDYMRKPFRIDELAARVKALLRRAGTPGDTLLRVGDLQIDMRTRRTLVGGHAVELTAREFTLLAVFMRRPDEVVSRQTLLSQVWGYYFEPDSNVVNVYISSLRRKLGTEIIETVRGVGYRLRPVHPAAPRKDPGNPADPW